MNLDKQIEEGKKRYKERVKENELKGRIKQNEQRKNKNKPKEFKKRNEKHHLNKEDCELLKGIKLYQALDGYFFYKEEELNEKEKEELANCDWEYYDLFGTIIYRDPFWKRPKPKKVKEQTFGKGSFRQKRLGKNGNGKKTRKGRKKL